MKFNRREFSKICGASLGSFLFPSFLSANLGSRRIVQESELTNDDFCNMMIEEQTRQLLDYMAELVIKSSRLFDHSFEDVFTGQSCWILTSITYDSSIKKDGVQSIYDFCLLVDNVEYPITAQIIANYNMKHDGEIPEYWIVFNIDSKHNEGLNPIAVFNHLEHVSPDSLIGGDFQGVSVNMKT